jgi:hypothetical protein
MVYLLEQNMRAIPFDEIIRELTLDYAQGEYWGE